MISDIDLSILGSPEAVYGRYEEAIRREYRRVPLYAYRRGRRRVLESFLKLSRIYATAVFRRRHEHASRANLKRALRRL